MNGQVEFDRGRMMWKFIGRPSVEHAAQVWWSGGHSTCRRWNLHRCEWVGDCWGQAIQEWQCREI